MTLKVFNPEPNRPPAPPRQLEKTARQFWRFALTMLPAAGVMTADFDDIYDYCQHQGRLTTFLQHAATNSFFDGRGKLALLYRQGVNSWELRIAGYDANKARRARRRRLDWMQTQIEKFIAAHVG